MLNLKSLKVFITVAELANMTAAGRRLGLSQSAASKAILQLEESAGAVLIARAAAARADRRGRRAAAARRRLVAEAETLFRSISERAGAIAAPRMVDSFAATVGPSLIKHLLSSAVQIRVGCAKNVLSLSAMLYLR